LIDVLGFILWLEIDACDDSNVGVDDAMVVAG